MIAPAFLTRIDIEPGRILVEVEVHAGASLTDEQAGRLRGGCMRSSMTPWPPAGQTRGKADEAAT